MAERALVFEGTQVGVESSKGTKPGGGANRRLLDCSFKLTPMTPLKPFRPQGSKAPTTATKEKEWSEGTLDGPLSYNSLVYLLSGLLDTAAITTPTSATNTRRWKFLPSNFNPDGYITYYIETGSTAFAESATFGLINEVKVRWTKTDAAVTGSILAQKLADSIMITSSPTNVAENPADPEDITLFLGTALTNEVQSLAIGGASSGTFTLTFTDPFKGTSFTTTAIAYTATNADIKTALTTALSNIQPDDITVTGSVAGPFTITFGGRMASLNVGALVVVDGTSGGTGVVITTTTQGGLTKLNRALECEWSCGGRFGGVFTLKQSTPSFDAEVEKAPTMTGELLLEADSEGVGFMTQLRAKTTIYIHKVALGALTEVSDTRFTYRLALTFAAKFIEAPRDGKDDLWAVTYKLSPIYDATLGGWVKWEIDNVLTAL